MDSSVSLPIAFWNTSKPVFRISAVCVSPNLKKLVTGSYNGQLCLWDLDVKYEKVTPRNILIGHEDSVTCMSSTNEYVISGCEGRKLCRWNLDDGYCCKMNTSLFVHRKMELFSTPDANEEFLFTCGDYPEIFVIHPFTLQVILIIHSKSNHSWISSFQVLVSQESCIVSGITVNGYVKMWVLNDLANDVENETKSYTIPISDIVDFKYNSGLTQVLVVSVNSWMVYDSEFTNCICQVEAEKSDRLLGGNFCDANVILWTKSGNSFLYKMSNGSYELISVFLDDFYTSSLFEPALSLLQSKEEKYLIKGDSQGRISIWKIDLQQKELHPILSTALADSWISESNGFFNSFVNSNVTCCIYVLEIDRFFVGCFDGSIIDIPATESILSFYFCSTAQKPITNTLCSHKGKVNCLLYPHKKYSYFNKSHLVSGGSDFCVCLWDIFKSELLFKFCVQSGEILRLIVPPKECNMPVRMSVCSVSSDHSVAVLNLKDIRCLILTSRHEFPVVSVHWKPLDDFIIVECFDGTIHVWQLQTGHLDRVLNGVIAQEVLFACSEPEPSVYSWNFYIQEHTVKENSMKHNVFKVQESTKQSPFLLNKFLSNEISESQMFVCDLESTFAQFCYSYESEALDYCISPDAYILTKALTKDLQGKLPTPLDKAKLESEKYEIVQEEYQCQKNNNVNSFIRDDIASEILNPVCSEKMLKLIQFFLSSIHFWGLNPNLDEFLISKLGLSKPEQSPCFGIPSYPGFYSLFLPTAENSWQKSSSLFASICVTMIALSKILLFSLTSDQVTESNKNWLGDLVSFYELNYLNSDRELAIPRPKIEILAKAWQTKCLPLRKIIRKFLCNYLQRLNAEESASLLGFWYKYLPHFKILDKTLPQKVDFENLDLKTVALVLFGAFGSDFKFKTSDSSCQENYVYQTCASFVYLMLLPNGSKLRFSALQTIAVDFIGRGYIVWEQFLKMEKVIPVLFKMCAGFSDKGSPVAPMDKCLSAYNALKAIAMARTSAFINCLKNELGQIKGQNLGQNFNFLTCNSKAEILSVMTFLLEKTPYIMLLYLNDVITLIVHCVDLSHLRQENLSTLIPVIQTFRQVHHSVVSQRIAVGLATGSVVIHDLRTGKVHEIPAHKDSVSALKFSEDGKTLASYSCYENRLSFWQVLTGIFGLGHVHIKCTKSCKTYEIHDEKIKNHLEIASLTWTDKKSVLLSLCDGTEDIFHS